MLKKYLFLLSFFAAASVSAGGGGMTTMPPYSGGDGMVIYTEDGSHSGTIDCDSNGCSFIYDGQRKSRYQYMEYPIVSGNDFFVLASDASMRRYLLKNGNVTASGETINVLYSFYAAQSSSIDGWSITDNGSYTLYKLDGSILLRVENAGSSTSSYYIASGALQTMVYNRNNVISANYINDKKIPTSPGAYIQTYGVYKKNKFTNELLLGVTNALGTMDLMFYNINTGLLRSLPSYDGVTQVVPIYNKNGTIKDFQYIVTVGSRFAFADMRGKLLTRETYDNINMFTTYGNSYLKTYLIGEKMYLSFDNKTYGPFDYIDTFNPSYGNQMNYTNIVRWSVFVKNNGKNYILVTGKLFPID